MKSRNAILEKVGIYEIELSPEKQKEFDRINRAYGAAFEKLYEARMKKYRAAEKKLRDFVINV